MNDIYVNEGDIIEKGESIGTVGMTGRAPGPHLHLNIYCNNININPELFFVI